MTQYISDIDEVDSRLQQVHGFAVSDAVTTKPVRDKRRIDLSGHICVSLEDVCYTFPSQFLMPIVEEQRSSEHITAVKTVLLHILL